MSHHVQDDEDDNDYDSVVSGVERTHKSSGKSSKKLYRRGNSRDNNIADSGANSRKSPLRKQKSGGQHGSATNLFEKFASTVGSSIARQFNPPIAKQQLDAAGPKLHSSVTMGTYNVTSVQKKREPSVQPTVRANITLTRPNAPVGGGEQQQTQMPHPMFLTNRQRRRLYRQNSSHNAQRDQSGPGVAAATLANIALTAPETSASSTERVPTPPVVTATHSIETPTLPLSASQTAPPPPAIISPRTDPAHYVMVGSDEVLPVVNILANLESHLQRQIRQNAASQGGGGAGSGGSNVHRAMTNEVGDEATPMNQQSLHAPRRRRTGSGPGRGRGGGGGFTSPLKSPNPSAHQMSQFNLLG
jgi:hypothetical protein